MNKKPQVQYSIDLSKASAHLFSLRLALPTLGLTELTLQMPAWIPGSYMIREFARQATNFKILTPLVSLEQISKDAWQIKAKSKLPNVVELSYQVYAYDTSVRGAYLDRERGFFNGTSLFFEALELDASYTITLEKPRGKTFLSKARVATALTPVKCDAQGFGRYEASDFDCLIDQPVEISDFLLKSFSAGGAQHHIVLSGMGALASHVDMNRLASDFKTIADEQIRTFEPRSGKAPMKSYWFLTNAIASGYGGLEHRDSTVLLCSRSDVPLLKGTAAQRGDAPGYRTFLGLVSHEYFHTWNVKRIKPAAFVPYATDQESYTKLLWIFEGFTSYYDDLVLARCMRLTQEQYLAQLASTLTALERDPGAAVDTVADSSFNAWTRYYRQDENSPNTLVSYYGKGSLVALCLDLTIRARTKGKKSLDDVMRLLWREFGEQFYAENADPQGLGEDAFPALVKRSTGLDLSKEIHQWAYSSTPLPYEALLEAVGVIAKRSSETYAALGAKVQTKAGEIHLATVYSDGTAAKAGLSNGDHLVAVGGFKATETVLQALLEQREGATLDIHVFRRDELHKLTLAIPEKDQTPTHNVALSLKAKPSKLQQQALETWLAPWPTRKITP